VMHATQAYAPMRPRIAMAASTCGARVCVHTRICMHPCCIPQHVVPRILDKPLERTPT
jgi:hypothetical protein